MADALYRVEFLPAALRDVVEIAEYISQELCNPSVAEKLVDKMITAAEGLSVFPYSHPLHRTARPLKHEYRKLLVKNYILFYWMDEYKKTVTIARVIYGRRDLTKEHLP